MYCPRGEEYAIAPFADQRCGMLVQPGRVAVVGTRFRVFEAFDLGMGDEQDDHVAVVA
jgi:hypothetical protein